MPSRRVSLAAACLLVLAGSACGAPDGPTAAADPATIGFLRAIPTGPVNPAFVDELARAGFHHGQTLRFLGDAPDEVHTDPADIEATLSTWGERGLDLLVAYSTSGADAARNANPDLKILFLVNDPRAAGLVEREDRPEGNLTGVTFRVPADRTLSLASRVVPGLDRVGLVLPANDPAARPHRDAVHAAAAELGISVTDAPFASESEVAAAVEAVVASGARALFVSNSPQAVRARAQIAAANADRLPVLANTTVVDYAVVVLEPDTTQIHRQLGRQAVRLLSGASPRSVPVEDPARFRVVLRQDRASRHGLTLPQDVVREADLVEP
ncbi:MAG TPA: ABC transporter substrate binding protein [Actinomycetota bacterium]|nr:ABC transporter substrate binding protein [Actinomycetota bacterium]